MPEFTNPAKGSIDNPDGADYLGESRTDRFFKRHGYSAAIATPINQLPVRAGAAAACCAQIIFSPR